MAIKKFGIRDCKTYRKNFGIFLFGLLVSFAGIKGMENSTSWVADDEIEFQVREDKKPKIIK